MVDFPFYTDVSIYKQHFTVVADQGWATFSYFEYMIYFNGSQPEGQAPSKGHKINLKYLWDLLCLHNFDTLDLKQIYLKDTMRWEAPVRPFTRQRVVNQLV